MPTRDVPGWLEQPRERRLAVLGGACLACWALWACLVQPLWTKVRDLRRHVDSQTQRLDSLGRLLQEAPSVEQDHAAFAPYLATEEDEQAQSALLNELEQLSQQAGVQMNLKPRPVKREERVSRLDVELDLEGSQGELLSFLDALLSMRRLVSIERLRIAAQPSQAGLLRANLVIQKITFHSS